MGAHRLDTLNWSVMTHLKSVTVPSRVCCCRGSVRPAMRSGRLWKDRVFWEARARTVSSVESAMREMSGREVRVVSVTLSGEGRW